ncbi:hypothetical protein HPB50_027219 [Hyalomma asiaticum]|uniref:Uncharacterized protein n=1 Tax=Hyalomma asiaticum TaxID=266040 RepID=A0ACB7TPM5_HYAAI|nr:hypothetical protein HPB50_027219 [Hyalomma asiaticum]
MTASDQEVGQQRKQRIAPVPTALPEYFITAMEEFLRQFQNLMASTPCLQDNMFHGGSEL